MSWPAVHPTRDIGLFVVVIFLRIKRQCRDSFAREQKYPYFDPHDVTKPYIFSAVCFLHVLEPTVRWAVSLQHEMLCIINVIIW
jgi:hypothetical protein